MVTHQSSSQALSHPSLHWFCCIDFTQIALTASPRRSKVTLLAVLHCTALLRVPSCTCAYLAYQAVCHLTWNFGGDEAHSVTRFLRYEWRYECYLVHKMWQKLRIYLGICTIPPIFWVQIGGTSSARPKTLHVSPFVPRYLENLVTERV